MIIGLFCLCIRSLLTLIRACAYSCSSSTNSTESEVVKPKEKYMSERPDTAQKEGDVIKVVVSHTLPSSFLLTVN